MRPLFRSLLGLCILGAPAAASGQERDDEPIYRLMPAPPGAKPLEVKERQTGWYSAVSKLKNTDTRDGIGVRWNWPKELGDKPWGAKGTISLVAFPEEAVAYGKHRGMALRLINRGKEPATFDGCDSGLPIIQEARDAQGRWREIEDTRSSWCGNSYHQLSLGATEYWEFAAPVYTGATKTKIRFRLDASDLRGGNAKDHWIYSNEFDGAVTKAQLRMGPNAVEIRKAFSTKDATEAGVMETLIALLAEDEKDRRRSHLPQRAVERLSELGPAAKKAVPALRKVRDEKTGELRALVAYALWRIDGDAPACVKTLITVLEARDDWYASAYAAGYLWRMGAAARDAVPALCRAIENGEERTQEVAIGALGGIRAHPDVAVPALVKALKPGTTRRADVVARALGEFGAEAKAAVPALLDLVKRTKDHERVEVAFALWKIKGKPEPTVPILIEEVRSGQAYWAAERLGEIGPPAKAAIPDLTRVLKNDDYGLIAAHALWKITQQSEPTLSTAIRALEKKDAYRDPRKAIGILEEMGPQARPAVPALLEVHRSARMNAHDSLREEVENALRKIDPAAAKKAGIR